tara:strand:- start:486 stop:1307 length:822 start_codon:yes stop_codon:yes gene_type:complete
MKDIIYISDFFDDEIIGGAELSDGVVIKYLKEKGVNLKTVKSQTFSPNIHKADVFIISNFTGLSEESKLWFQESATYIIIERDQKYVDTRNTAMYDGFIAPQSKVVNKSFYSHAKKVFCLTHKQAEIMNMHLDIENIETLGCTQFSQDQFDHIRKMYKEKKDSKWCIVPGKRSNKAIQLCETQSIPYDYLKNCKWNELIETISSYQGIVFFSHAFESCCRLVLEARMLGLKVKTDNRVGCTYEEWFGKYKGIELISFLETKVEETLERIYSEI